MDKTIDIQQEIGNPLDSIEDIMAGHDWSFTRAHDDELFVHVTGARGTYRMTFFWQEEFSAMQLFCEFDLHIPKKRDDMACRALRTINDDLWLGHFDVPQDSRTPIYRHTTLFRGMADSSGADHVADLIEIALAHCERSYPLFNMLASAEELSDDVITLAMTESAGTA